MIPTTIDLGPKINENKTYEMNKKKRGWALVVNNIKFEDNRLDRHGVLQDSINIRSALEKIEFDVELHENKTAQQMQAILWNFSRRDHSENDAFLCVLMSHGNENVIQGADGVLIGITDLLSPLTKCESLKGKPKIFFINATQGPVAFNRFSTIVTTENAAPCDKSDFFIHYSTVTGYVSFRNKRIRSGTWFIQALCDVLTEHGQSMSLSQISDTVNEKIAIFNEKENSGTDNSKLTGLLQIDKSHIMREVYFKPKSGLVNEPNVIRNGFGTYTSLNGDKYEGYFVDLLKHGKGVLFISTCI